MTTYRLVRPGHGHIDFSEYQAMLAALHQFRTELDDAEVYELAEDGSVQAHLNNAELRHIVAELDAIVLPTLHSKEQKDT